MQHWKTLSSRYVVRDRWLRLRADSCETADGTVIEPYYINEADDWVHIVGFDDQDRILLVKQYRHGLGQVTVELPGGAVDAKETPLLGAQRELLEETGYRAERYEMLTSVSPNPATHTNRMHTFMAFGLKQIAEPNFDESECIESFFQPWRAVLEDMLAGKMLAGLHVASIFEALMKRKFIAQIA